MNNFLKNVLVILLCFVVSVLVSIFINGNIYIFNWETNHRAATILFWLILVCCYFIDNDTK